MKYIKILALSLFTLAFSACSEDEVVLNSGDATVEFENASVEIKESVPSVNLPIVVKGEHNGEIIVNATMTEKSEGIEIDKNVIITTETLNIGKDTESVNLEVSLSGIASDEVLEGRSITFEIKDVKGATIGTNSTCTVKLIENNPMEGTYVMGGVDAIGTGYITCNLTMEEGVDDVAYLDFGFGGKLKINLNNISEPYKKCNFTIAPAQSVGGDYTAYFGFIQDNQLYFDPSTGFSGKFENNTFTFTIDDMCGIVIYKPNVGGYFYVKSGNTPLTIYKK